MSNKVTIELSPFAAVAIMHTLEDVFLRDQKDYPELAAMRETTKEYAEAVARSISEAQIDDAMLLLRVHEITGQMPKQNITGPEGE